MARGWAPSRPTTIYKPLKQIESLALPLGKTRDHRTLKQEPPDAQHLHLVLRTQPRVHDLNLTRSSITIIFNHWAQSSRHRTCPVLIEHVCREFVKRTGSPDAHHRTRSEHPVPYPESAANAQGHWTHTTGLSLSVQWPQSKAPAEVR